MTINSTTRKAGPFVGNGTVSAFPFGFKVFQASDLFVVRLNVSAAVEQTLVLNSDYSVTLNPDQNSNPGGVVTLSSALASGYTLTLTSDVPDTQPTDLTNQGGFYPEVINDALDRATIQIQQVQEEIDRTLTAPISTPVGTNLEFPLPSANKFIGWNSTATGLQNLDASSLASIVAFATAYADTFNGDGATSTFTLSYPPATVRNLDVSINGVTQVPVVDYNINGQALNFTTPPPLGSVVLAKYWQALPNSSGAAQDFTLTPNGYTTAVDVQEGFDDLGSSAGTSKVGFLQAGTGAQARSAQDKLRDVVSVKDFGAVGDGVTDDTAAIQAAVDALQPYQTLTAEGDFLMSEEVFVKQSNITLDFASAKFNMTGATYTGYGSGFFFGDPTDKTLKPENVTVIGGEYYPAGNSQPFPLADFNPIAVVIGKNFTFYNLRIFPKQSTRAVSLQTDNTYGDGVTPNIQNVRIYGLTVMGDGDAVDGVDVTSSGGDGLIKDVYVEGYVSGCKRGASVSTGSDSYNFDNINFDLTVKGATEVGFEFYRVANSVCRINLLDVTKAGAVVRQIYNSDFDFLITGEAGALTTGLAVQEGASTPGQNRIRAQITGAFTTGLAPNHNDVVYDSILIDGATLGVDVSGFRSTWGLVVFKNCTTNVDDLSLPSDKWSLVITQGTGANPVVIKRESDFVTTFASGDASPSVLGATFCRTSGTTTITGFDDGVLGQTITLLADNNITIQQGANIKLAGGVDCNMTALDTLTLVTYAAGVWVEVSRSVNA